MNFSLITVKKKIIINNYSLFEKKIQVDFPKFNFNELVDSSDYKYFIILYNNKFAGFFMLYKKNRIQKFYILPSFRGKGWGSKIINILLGKKIKLNCYVKMNNTGAINFYKKNGFKIKKRLPKAKILFMSL